MKKTGRVILWIVGIFVSLFILTAITVAVVCTPGRVTPLINKYANRYLHATISVDTASIRVLHSFPHLNIVLGQGSVIVPQFYDSIPAADSVLVFQRLECSLRLLPLLYSHVNIKHIALQNARVYLCETQDGRANWDLFGSDPNDTTGTSLGLNVRSFAFGPDVQIVYNSLADSVYYDTHITRLNLKARPIGTLLEASLDTDHNTLVVGADSLFNQVPLLLEGQIGLGLKPSHGNVSLDFDEYTFKECNAVIGTVPLYLDGFLGLRPDSVDLRATCRIDSSTVANVLEVALPFVDLGDYAQAIHTEIPIHLDISLNGAYYYETGSIPAFDAHTKIGPGLLIHKPSGLTIPHFVSNVDFNYDPRHGNMGNLSVNEVCIESNSHHLDTKGTVTSFFDDPRFDIVFDGHFDLDSLSALFMDKDKFSATGKLSLNGEAKCAWSDLSFTNIGKAYIVGDLKADRLRLRMPQDSLLVIADSTRIGIHATPGESLSAKLKSDSLNVLVKYKYKVQLKNTTLSIKSSSDLFSEDTTRVQPLSGLLATRYMNFQTTDSTLLRASTANVSFSINPLEGQPHLPVMQVHLDAGVLAGQVGLQRAAMQHTNLDAVLTMNAEELSRKERMEHRLDSLQAVYPNIVRDSLWGHSLRIDSTSTSRRRRPVQDEFTQADIRFGLDRGLRSELRLWDIQGKLTAKRLVIGTPYLPIRNSIRNLDLSIYPSYMDLSSTHITCGRSDLLLTGRITNLKQLLQGRGQLGVNLDIQSDTLDCNQILQAINSGTILMEDLNKKQSAALKQQLMTTQSNDALNRMLAAQTDSIASENPLIIIPGNLNLEAALAVSNTYYGHLQLRGVHGLVRTSDRVMQLQELTGKSSAGNVVINALYATPDRSHLRVGLDVDISQMQLKETLRLFPSLDTLLPMLQSFEGVVDLQFAASSYLDSTMNFQLPTLQGACRLKGKDMVLLDGETFTEISQKLMFKNKARNLIDSIRVEITVDDSKINVYPFIMEMDRYQAAVSGIHNLDMTFDYHISLLQSPLPFRVGVNVTGNLDKPKIDVGKCLYKNTHIPSYSEKIDSVRVNLKDVILHYFK